MNKFQKVADKISNTLSPRVKGRKEVMMSVESLAKTCGDLNTNLDEKMEEIVDLRGAIEDQKKEIDDLKVYSETYDEVYEKYNEASFYSSAKTFIILGLVIGYVLSIIF